MPPALTARHVRRAPSATRWCSASLRYLALSRGEADLAIRARPSNQPELVTVATSQHRQFIDVARALAGRLGNSPSLADIPWLAWAPPYSELPPNPQLTRLVPGFAPALTTARAAWRDRCPSAGSRSTVAGVGSVRGWAAVLRCSRARGRSAPVRAAPDARRPQAGVSGAVNAYVERLLVASKSRLRY